jgi:hypothetical protein
MVLDMHQTGTLRLQGRGVDQEPGRKQQNGNCRRPEKLERGKRASLRYNQMEALHKGPVFHIGTKGQNDDDDEQDDKLLTSRLLSHWRVAASSPFMCKPKPRLPR